MALPSSGLRGRPRCICSPSAATRTAPERRRKQDNHPLVYKSSLWNSLQSLLPDMAHSLACDTQELDPFRLLSANRPDWIWIRCRGFSDSFSIAIRPAS